MRRPFDPQQQLFYYPETRSRPLSTNTRENTLKSTLPVWQCNIRWIGLKLENYWDSYFTLSTLSYSNCPIVRTLFPTKKQPTMLLSIEIKKREKRKWLDLSHVSTKLLFLLLCTGKKLQIFCKKNHVCTSKYWIFLQKNLRG